MRSPVRCPAHRRQNLGNSSFPVASFPPSSPLWRLPLCSLSRSTTKLSDFPSACNAQPCPRKRFANRPYNCLQRTMGISGSRVWIFHTMLRVLRLRRVHLPCHFASQAMLLPLSGQGRHTEKRISELNTWPALPPVRERSADVVPQSHLRRKRVDGYSFFVPETSSLSQNRFIPATLTSGNVPRFIKIWFIRRICG